MGRDRLTIYLNDHLAGAAVGLALCRRCRDQNRGSELGSFLERLATEIEDDDATLRRVMERAGAPESRLKQGLAAVAERLGRLKLNGQLTGYSPLSRQLELEGLSAGIEGKRLLWLALAELGDARLAAFDFEALADRAERQRGELEPYRLAAARTALAT